MAYIHLPGRDGRRRGLGAAHFAAGETEMFLDAVDVVVAAVDLLHRVAKRALHFRRCAISSASGVGSSPVGASISPSLSCESWTRQTAAQRGRLLGEPSDRIAAEQAERLQPL
jgi:hypothetical protein